MQNHEEGTLTEVEKLYLEPFRKEGAAAVPVINHSDSDSDSGVDYAAKVIAEHASKKARVGSDMYINLNHILATSNICERLFSRCSLIMTPMRSNMDPSSMELLIFLRENKHLWDVYTVAECITEGGTDD